MKLLKLEFLLLLLIAVFCFGCASKNIVKNEIIKVCVIPDKKQSTQMEKIKSDLENKAINKFMEKHKSFSPDDLIFTDRFYYNLKEIDKFCLKAKISADKNNHNSNDNSLNYNNTYKTKQKKFVLIKSFTDKSKPEKYNKNLVIINSGQDIGISSTSDKQSHAEFFTNKNENLEILFHIKHKLSNNDLKEPVHKNILKINYINSREDQIKFIAEKNQDSIINCDIMLDRQKSQNMKTSFENNYNTFKIIKSKRQISIWLNNDFAGAFLAGGDIVKSIKFNIDNKTILKHLEIKEL